MIKELVENENYVYLVVDDDDTFRSRLTEAFIDREIKIYSSKSVVEAIEILESQKIDRIVADLKMPEQTGLELLDYVSKHFPDVDLVILTGYGSISTALTAVKMGALNFLTKPVNFTQIISSFNNDDFQIDEFEVPSLSQVEWEHMQRVVNDCQGNISKAAKLLGMHRRSLQRKLQKAPNRIV